MKKKTTIVAVVILLSVSSALAFVTAGPWISMYMIKNAVAENDISRLESFVDFTSLQTSFKAQLNEKVQAQFDASDQKIYATLVANFSAMLIDGMVESIVTPRGVALLMSGKSFSKMGKRLITKTEEALLDNDAVEKFEQTEDKQQLFKNARIEYEANNKAYVYVPNDIGYETRFTFKREGLQWKLSDIELPIDEE